MPISLDHGGCGVRSNVDAFGCHERVDRPERDCLQRLLRARWAAGHLRRERQRRGVVANPNGLTGSCGGGTIAATAGSGTISLRGATLAANEFCNSSVTALATTAGTKNNVTDAVTFERGRRGRHRIRHLDRQRSAANATAASEVTPVPTLQQWALSLLALALIGAAALMLRHRRRR
ncbi:MAG TPA: hypothetical protein VJ891_15650 [Casimicrobiaceae bacterium]|nr:hypothetical protein [Casimicrobiaceae bacterium]